MTKHELEILVCELISLGKEGAYWDFKQEWHTDTPALLKDIICFTNTVHEKDCYIIFGVNDDMEIVGMRTQRRKQADILDALDKLSFASVHTPQITVETITLEEKEIDVLVIYNTDQTPVYLKKPYGKMLAGCIYTRAEDRNTPDGGNAEIEQIEYLWRKRFGLTKPALQFIIEHLSNKYEWNELDSCFYNIYRPEYVLRFYADDSIDNNSDEFYGYVQTNESMSFEMLDIVANNTVLLSHQLVVLDSGRLTLPIPEWGFIYRDNYCQSKIAYKYYVKGSDTYRLLEFLYSPENMDQRWAFMRHKEVVLIYNSEEEKNMFEDYCLLNIDKIEAFLEENMEKSQIDTNAQLKKKVYTERILTGKFLNTLLLDFRKSNHFKEINQ